MNVNDRNITYCCLQLGVGVGGIPREVFREIPWKKPTNYGFM